MTHKHKNIEKQIIWNIITIVTAILLSCNAKAFPIPRGISGTIFTPEGEEVPAGTFFSVNDTTTGEFIIGRTGHLSSGSYSVSLDGNDGDEVIIRAWNRYHSTNTSVILEGVMYGIDLVLNTTPPNQPPRIVTEPITKAFQNKEYRYDVNATDPDMDKLNYSLIEHPQGMVINHTTGVIRWIPKYEDIGNNSVRVIVSDGLLNDTQSFVVEVKATNSPPKIVSEPVTTADTFNVYFYWVEVEDPDNDTISYYLTEKPDGMFVIPWIGLILWLPSQDDIGTHKVTVKVSDGNLTDSQTYNITVTDAILKTESFKVGPPSVKIIENCVIIDLDNTSIDSIFEECESKDNVKVFNVKKLELAGIPKTINAYESLRVTEFDISNSKVFKNNPENATIEFNVAKKWINKNKISRDSVRIYKKTNRGFKELPTKIVAEDKEYVYYSTVVTDLSEFVIGVTKNTPQKDRRRTSKLSIPHVIIGTVYNYNGKEPIKNKTTFVIKNLETNKTIKGKTGGPTPGSYVVVVHGDNSTRISIKMGSNSTEHVTTLTGDVIKIDFIYDKNNGKFVPYNKPKKSLIGWIVLIITLSGVLLVKFSIKRLKKNGKSR